MMNVVYTIESLAGFIYQNTAFASNFIKICASHNWVSTWSSYRWKDMFLSSYTCIELFKVDTNLQIVIGQAPLHS